MSSSFINYSALHSEHYGEDLCIQLSNQRIGISYNHNSNGRFILIPDFC